MVKPSKCMQPEHVDLQKASRRTGKGAAFGEDSFRNYMALKIANQRKQFGLVLPPPPVPAQSSVVKSGTQYQTTTVGEKQSISAHEPLASTASSQKKSIPYKRPTLLERRSSSFISHTHQNLALEVDDKKEDELRSSERSVRFVDEMKSPDPTRAEKKRKRSKMESMIHRLKRRHGRGNKKLEKYTTKTEEKLNRENSVESHSPNQPREENRPVRPTPKEDGLSELLRMFEANDHEKLKLSDPPKDIPANNIGEEKLSGEVVKDSLSELVYLFSATETKLGHPLSTNDDFQEPTMCPSKGESQKIHSSTSGMKIGTDEEDEDMDGLLLSTAETTTNASLSSPPFLSPKTIRKSRPDLFFYGIVVKVAGYTYPDNETIKRLLQKHGGDLEAYETERVTHIIAEQLSTAKANVYKKQKRPKPVCRPAWIVDSAREGRLLPHGNYLLVEEREQQQMGIQSMFQKQKAEGSKDTPALKAKNPYAKLRKTVLNKDVAEMNIERQDAKTSLLGSKTTFSTPKERDPKKFGNTTNLDIPNEKSNPRSSSKGTESNDPKITNSSIKALAKSKVREPWDPVRTVGNDPNFLDSYFAKSRLSFIGSFKQRAAATNLSAKFSPATVRSNAKRLIFHVDMDCFFASVVLRNFPQYRDKPVVISHHGKRSDQHDKDGDLGSFGNSSTRCQSMHIPKNSWSECATCNYEARKYGIKKGMFLGRAKELCPDLVVLSYDFEGYEEVSQQVSEILDHFAYSDNHDGIVEMVSCDEAYVEISVATPDSGGIDTDHIHDKALELANTVRREIFQTTQCTASIGVGENKFLAKLGTDKAKPNNSYFVRDYKELLKDLKLRDIHGVGWRTEKKLTEEGLVAVQDIWDLGPRGETELIRILGAGTGSKIFRFTQGKDDRSITPVERKTIGAECNYGVRFDGPYGIDYFMEGLAKEVEKRMVGISMKGKRLTLKIKKRKKGASNVHKFLGHGSCHNLSKSANIPGNLATRDSKVFKKLGMSLFREFGIGDINEIRGMGIIISNLDNDDAVERESEPIGMKQWIQRNVRQEMITEEKIGIYHHRAVEENAIQNPSASTSTPEKEMPQKPEIRRNGDPKPKDNIESPLVIDLPPMSQIRLTQVEALPPELQKQIYSRIKEEKRTVSVAEHTQEPTDIARETTLLDQTGVFEGFDDENATIIDRARSSEPLPCSSPVQDSDDEEVEVTETRKNESPLMIELPPLSQIQMSQVEALPLDLKQQIFSRIKGRTATNTVDGVEIDNCVTNEVDSTREFDRSFTHQVGTGLQQQGGGRFRQTDLKRMMRLAAVKSGHESTEISLTQLDQLPLEIKLQVVNHDDRQVGILSQHASRRERKSTSVFGDNRAGLLPKEASSTSVSAKNHKDSSEDNAKAVTAVSGKDCQPQQIKRRMPRFRMRESVDSWVEDVLPLKEFLNNNCPITDPNSLQMVIDFLSITLKEGRSTTMVTMIRSIRNRADNWSRFDVLEKIVNTMSTLNIDCYGSRLDTSWLMGTSES